MTNQTAELYARHARLIDLLAALSRYESDGFSGVSAVSWPEKKGSMADYYATAEDASTHLQFANKALEQFHVCQNAEVLDIAEHLIESSRQRAITALNMGVERKGNVNRIDDFAKALLALQPGESSAVAQHP